MDSSVKNGGLEFSIGDVFPVGTESIRHRVAFEGEATIGLNYGVPSAKYETGTRGLTIETEYAAKVQGEEDNATVVDIGYFRHRVLVSLVASREVTDEDAANGLLDAAVEIANRSAHPYHRLAIISMTAHLGLPPITLPANFEMVPEPPSTDGTTS